MMFAPISEVPDISKTNTPEIAPSLTKFPLISKFLPAPVIPAVKVAIEAVSYTHLTLPTNREV